MKFVNVYARIPRKFYTTRVHVHQNFVKTVRFVAGSAAVPRHTPVNYDSLSRRVHAPSAILISYVPVLLLTFSTIPTFPRIIHLEHLIFYTVFAYIHR